MSKLLEILKDPLKTKKLFLKFQDELEDLNNYKDLISADDLAHNYTIINKRFLKIREACRRYILSDDKLYKIHLQACSKDFLYDMLLDGWSYDINKVTDNDFTLAFIPFKHQMSLIDALIRDDKMIHVEKSRRQGASKIFVQYMKWLLRFGKNVVMYATHKDLESLDIITGDTGHNSTFDNVKWLLNKSMWIIPGWESGIEEDGERKIKKIKIGNNVLMGAVLGKGTAVGMAGTHIFVDEIDVVCDMFPNQAEQIMGSFTMSVNRVYLYSTYRSMKYPFYQYKARRDAGWTFISLYWKDNPTCNIDWYNRAKNKMGNDKVLVARELDMDPTKVRKGTVFAEETSIINYYKQIDYNRRLKKVIGADFGGGSSLTSFVLGYLDLDRGILFIHDFIESTKLDEKGIKAELVAKGFDDVEVFADQSAFSQIGAKGHDWNTLLRTVGVKLKAISNKSIMLTHALMRQSLLDGLIMLNESNLKLVERWLNYHYKDDEVAKDENSHFGDACSYLYRGIFYKSELGVF